MGEEMFFPLKILWLDEQNQLSVIPYLYLKTFIKIVCFKKIK